MLQNQDLEKKEQTLTEKFSKEQQEAVVIEEQIKALQTKYQEKVVNMTRLQGAFALIADLKKDARLAEPLEPEPTI